MGQRLKDERCGDEGACVRCGLGFRADEFPTRLYLAQDPHSGLGLTGSYHDHCALPVWAFAAPPFKQVAEH